MSRQTWQEGDPCSKCGGPMTYSRWFENHWCQGHEDDEAGGCGHREPPIPERGVCAHHNRYLPCPLSDDTPSVAPAPATDDASDRTGGNSPP